MVLELVELQQTCHSCPSQWEGKTKDGKTFYARYRHSYWCVEVGGETVADGETREIDGASAASTSWSAGRARKG